MTPETCYLSFSFVCGFVNNTFVLAISLWFLYTFKETKPKFMRLTNLKKKQHRTQFDNFVKTLISDPRNVFIEN